MKFACFDSTDDTLLSISGITTLGYGLSMAAAPDLQQKLYFEDHVPASTQWTHWFGNGLIMAGTTKLAENEMRLTKVQKKTALKACAVTHSLAAGLMTKQMLDGDFNKPIGIASTAFQVGLALACAVRSTADAEA